MGKKDHFKRPSAALRFGRQMICRWLLSSLAILLVPIVGRGQTMKSPDISKEPTLYVVSYAHLDTQWRWEFPQTISEHLLKTMRVNFDYMDKYPHYVFNWTGANRYRLMKEYFPDDYARMKGYIARGQWFPSGSSVEEGDVNLPSAEGIFRQILYGNTYFNHEFGKASSEFMLPDCFGFPSSLPSILAHAGIKGFSTQKLNAYWQPSPKVGGPDSIEQTPEGIPFNLGLWIGPDGKSVLAALNPGGYSTTAFTDLSKDPGPAPPPPQLTDEQRSKLNPQQLRSLARPREWEQNWVKRIDLDGKITGVYADFHYVGTGDIGGAPPESTVKLLEAIVTKSKTVLPAPPGPNIPFATVPQNNREVLVGDGPVHVIEAAADQIFNAIGPDMTSHMPQYAGDLELINHSAGSLTSQAYHKRQVIRNENLADAAEKASIAADWMGGLPYARQRLNDAWTLELAGHFHDSAAGTATPLSYQYIWNDDTIASNQFATVLTSAGAAVASGLDTRAKGTPLVVYNALNIPREDLVEADITFANRPPVAVRVYGPDGKEVPGQLNGSKVLFAAQTPSVGYAVYDIVPAETPATASGLKVSQDLLENARYRVQLDRNGDVSSIYDKDLNKELLSGPMRLAISNDAPTIYPAWNMEFDQEQAPPWAYVGGPPQIRIKEKGPVRVSIEVTRETEGSKFVQTISLAAGDAGNRVEFSNAIDWKTLSANLKATIPLSASNAEATYNWDIGTTQRPNANARQFEVGSHRWIDLTDKSGSFGTMILTDCKNASDKPTDNTIRVTLLRSPGAKDENGRRSPYSDQANQDWGHHEFVFAVAGHAGGWRDAATEWQAYRLNDPLIVFATTSHPGSLGKSFSLLHLGDSQVRVLALKKAEESDELILRLVELEGKPAPDVHVSFAGPVTSAREVNAQEQPVGSASVSEGALVTSLSPYQPRTFALKLGAPAVRLSSVSSRPVKLDYDRAVASDDDTKTGGQGMDGHGNALPAEMLPSQIDYNGIHFQLAPPGTGKENAVVAKGQTIALPSGTFNRIMILAASGGEDRKASFRVGTTNVELNIESWGGFIGQWDTRVWKNEIEHDWAVSAHHAAWPPPDMAHRGPVERTPVYPDDYVGLKPGYTKPASLAWYASHHHTAAGLNEPYQYSYLFAYQIDVTPGTRTLTLPNDGDIRILAISVADDHPPLKPASPLYDMLGQTEPPQSR